MQLVNIQPSVRWKWPVCGGSADFFLLKVDYGGWEKKDSSSVKTKYLLFLICVRNSRNSGPTAKHSDLVVVYLVFGVFLFPYLC